MSNYRVVILLYLKTSKHRPKAVNRRVDGSGTGVVPEEISFKNKTGSVFSQSENWNLSWVLMPKAPVRNIHTEQLPVQRRSVAGNIRSNGFPFSFIIKENIEIKRFRFCPHVEEEFQFKCLIDGNPIRYVILSPG